MAVMTASLKPVDFKAGSKKSKKSLEKCRPITATLEHPLILDIKLLQKLDMTTFTKRGLVALSKFCGISLITHKTRSKRKLMKSIQGPGSNKQISKQGAKPGTEAGDPGDKCEQVKCKRTLTKSKMSKFKPQFNFKIVELEASVRSDDKEAGAETEEEATDVVCKKHGTGSSERSLRNKQKLTRDGSRSTEAGDTCTLEVVPEPCKSCNRSQHPERLHSHPRAPNKTMKATEERHRSSNKARESADCGRRSSENCSGRGKNLCAKGSLPPQEMLLSLASDRSRASPTGTKSPLLKSQSASKSTEGREVSEHRLRKKSESPSPGRSSAKAEGSAKDAGSKLTRNASKEERRHGSRSPEHEDLKYVTGCYVCGSQVSSKTRMKHEKECIAEWRTHNSLLAPENRKPEPRRPDYRFTATGDVDFEGTFESIWANHKDSLVPCKSCGRKFFPDRIERHESCCSNLALRLNYKH